MSLEGRTPFLLLLYGRFSMALLRIAECEKLIDVILYKIRVLNNNYNKSLPGAEKTKPSLLPGLNRRPSAYKADALAN